MEYQLQKQHDKKKYHAIERIALLLDRGTFCEIGSGIKNYISGSQKEDMIPYDGVITGRGKIGGKRVFIFAQDFTVKAGTIGKVHGDKIAHTIELAMRAKCPVIGIYDSGGARIEEGINALAGCGKMMYYNSLASGVVPQISIIVGPCAGAAAYSPALTDFVYIVDNVGYMFITGADVVESVTGEKCSNQELGGAKVQAFDNGVAQFFSLNEKLCYEEVRKLIAILPASYEENPGNDSIPYMKKESESDEIIPKDPHKSYDIHTVIDVFLDEDTFIEVSKDYAASMVVGFGKLSGITVGLIANQPMVNSGVIDCNSSDKAARFLRFCDCFNIPIITLVDTPGYMPGKEQEHMGIIRHGAKLLYAYSEATVPKITVIVRKAYGGAYIAMGSKHMGTDYVYAFEDAEIAVMGAEGAAAVLYKKEANKIEDSSKGKKFLQEKAREYKEQYMNPYIAVQEGYVDEIITLKRMRRRIFEDITALSCKEERHIKKHGNIPL